MEFHGWHSFTFKMSNRQLNIDTDNLVKFTARLERLSKNDIPRVVKKTLDAAAMDVKQNTMPKQADKSFERRDKNFFKVNSKVEFSDRSKPIEKQKSVIGFVETKLRSDNNFSVKNLEQQEYGGRISGRSFIPTEEARGSKGTPTPKNRITKIDQLVMARERRGRSRATRFIRAMHKAGKNGHILSESGVVWKVTSLNRDSQGKLKIKKLYMWERKRSFTVSPTGFMQKSSLKSAKKLDEIYIREAKKQIDFRLSKT